MPIETAGLTPILENFRLSLSGAMMSDGHWYVETDVCSAARSAVNTALNVRFVGSSRRYKLSCSMYGRISVLHDQDPSVSGMVTPFLSLVFHPAGNFPTVPW